MFYGKLSDIYYKGYSYKFAVVNTPKLETVLVRLVKYTQTDVLTSLDLMKTQALTLVSATGGFISSKQAIVVSGMLSGQ
jgi:hypothetical protein